MLRAIFLQRAPFPEVEKQSPAASMLLRPCGFVGRGSYSGVRSFNQNLCKRHTWHFMVTLSAEKKGGVAWLSAFWDYPWSGLVFLILRKTINFRRNAEGTTFNLLENRPIYITVGHLLEIILRDHCGCCFTSNSSVPWVLKSLTVFHLVTWVFVCLPLSAGFDFPRCCIGLLMFCPIH